MLLKCFTSLFSGILLLRAHTSLTVSDLSGRVRSHFIVERTRSTTHITADCPRQMSIHMLRVHRHYRNERTEYCNVFLFACSKCVISWHVLAEFRTTSSATLIIVQTIQRGFEMPQALQINV